MLKLGLRTEPSLIGDHDRQTQEPLPDRVSARHEDLATLMEGLFAFDRRVSKRLDPIIEAAVLAFGLSSSTPMPTATAACIATSSTTC